MLFAAGGNNAFAGWQAGARTVYDSNINRSVDNRESDAYLSSYASVIRQTSGESRLGWFGEMSLEGTLFINNHDLNYVMISGSAGMTYFIHAFWRVDIAPFLEAKAVNDSEQSALAFGGKVSMQQQIKRDIYTGQYYIYRDSRADTETYSFTEHMFGVFLGVNWTEALFTEVYYEFSQGDSFRTISTNSTTSTILPGNEKGHGNSGKERKITYSETFGSDMIREDIDQHAIGASVGIDWNSSLSSQIGYTLATTDGELGTSRAHTGFLDISYRF